MNRFRSRLLFALLTLIIIVLIGLGLLLGQLFKSFYVQNFHDRLEKEVSLVEIIVSEKGLGSKELHDELDSISKILRARATVFSDKGKILLDSNGANLPVTDKDLQDFVKKRINEQDGVVREGGNSEVYYYGAPIVQNNQKVGSVVLSASIDSLDKINTQIWGVLIGSLGMALVVILLLGVKIMNQYTKPIESATKVAMELARGNYKARTYEDYVDETGMLSQAINILARNLQELIASQEVQQDRLRTLIENMDSGLILIDEKGYINLINRSYKDTFKINPTDYLYQLYYEAFSHREIAAIVEEIFMTELRVRKSIVIPINIERRHFEVYGSPIIGLNDEWKGIILVFHDVTELKKLEQMRKDFVANVSHELKTPITSITGFSETLLEGAGNDEEIRNQFLKIIHKEGQRMQSLIQDLLDLSKIEQQGYKLTIAEVNLVEVIEEIIMILKEKAKSKGIELAFYHEKEEMFIEADSERLKQIFINLINNAITYTPSGGKVTLKMRDGRQGVEVLVKDTGIGVSEEEIPRIFERFYRVDRARSRNSGGTGLGLAIVKHLIEAHHGQIDVESAVGEGTTFKVNLKKKQGK